MGHSIGDRTVDPQNIFKSLLGRAKLFTLFTRPKLLKNLSNPARGTATVNNKWTSSKTFCHWKLLEEWKILNHVALYDGTMVISTAQCSQACHADDIRWPLPFVVPGVLPFWDVLEIDKGEREWWSVDSFPLLLQSHASQFKMFAIVFIMSLPPLRQISISFCSKCTKDDAWTIDRCSWELRSVLDHRLELSAHLAF